MLISLISVTNGTIIHTRHRWPLVIESAIGSTTVDLHGFVCQPSEEIMFCGFLNVKRKAHWVWIKYGWVLRSFSIKGSFVTRGRVNMLWCSSRVVPRLPKILRRAKDRPFAVKWISFWDLDTKLVGPSPFTACFHVWDRRFFQFNVFPSYC